VRTPGSALPGACVAGWLAALVLVLVATGLLPILVLVLILVLAAAELAAAELAGLLREPGIVLRHRLLGVLLDLVEDAHDPPVCVVRYTDAAAFRPAVPLHMALATYPRAGALPRRRPPPTF